MRLGVLFIVWFALAPMPAVGANLDAVISRAIDRDETCGSVNARKRDRKACTDESWRTLCAELTDALSRTGPRPHTLDAALRQVDDQTDQFVGKLVHDLLCAPDAEPVTEPVSKWKHLDSLNRQRTALGRAAGSFAAKLASATTRTARCLSDLDNGVGIFRTARELGVGTEDATDDLRDRFRYIDEDGEDLTEYVHREQIERAESCIEEVRAFELVFEGRPLAALELAQNRARLLNSLRVLEWGMATFETDLFVRIPVWLSAGESPPAELEVAVPRSPSLLRLGTGLSPLSRPKMLSEVGRRVLSFLESVESNPEDEPTDAACRSLADGVNDLEQTVYVELNRLLDVDNPDGYRSVRSELFTLDLLGMISQGNRALVDSCGADRNEARWHRRFMQQTVDLTWALNPGAGQSLRALLRNTFSERLE